MQNNLFGTEPTNKVSKNYRRTKLKIELKLGKVCLPSKTHKNGFVCRGIPYSPNFLNRKHWAIRARWKKAWDQEVWGRWMEEKKKWLEYVFPLSFKIKLDIYVHYIQAQDEDNMYAAMKGIIDGLVNCGIIKDDTMDDITSKIHYIPVKKRVAEHIELVITKHVRK